MFAENFVIDRLNWISREGISTLSHKRYICHFCFYHYYDYGWNFIICGEYSPVSLKLLLSIRYCCGKLSQQFIATTEQFHFVLLPHRSMPTCSMSSFRSLCKKIYKRSISSITLNVHYICQNNSIFSIELRSSIHLKICHKV